MSRLPELHRILVEGARRLETEKRASRSVRRWLPWVRWRQPLLVGLVIFAGASTAGAVIAITSSSPSRPLHGRVPGKIPGPFGGKPSITGARYNIAIFPYLEVGWSGWCSSVSITYRGARLHGNYGCGAQETPFPTVLESGTITLGARYAADYLVVDQRVAAVRFPDGQLIRPLSQPGLPSGWRAVVHLGRPRFRRVRISSPAGDRMMVLPYPQIPLVLDADGRPIPQIPVTRAAAVQRLPLATVNPASPARSRCALRSVGHAVALISETLATLPAAPRPTDRGTLLSCANAIFRVRDRRVGVAVLINATDPNGPLPDLPGVRAVGGHLSVRSGVGSLGMQEGSTVDVVGAGEPPSATASRDITAVRVGHAWLVAQGATPAIRAALLSSLKLG